MELTANLIQEPTINAAVTGLEVLKGDKGDPGDPASATDVRINGTSITVDGVADVPLASLDKYGAVKSGSYKDGVYVDSNGLIKLQIAGIAQIDDRSSRYQPINPKFLDYAVKAAMCDGKGASWTNAEKLAARERVGLEWETIFDQTLDEPVGVSSWAQIQKSYKEFLAFSVANESGVSSNGFSYFQISQSASAAADVVKFEMPFANNGNRGGISYADTERGLSIRVLNGNTITNTGVVGGSTFKPIANELKYFRFYTNSGQTIPAGVRIVLMGRS